MPEELAVKNDLICDIFSEAFDRNQIINEVVAGRILGYVPRVLADLNRKFADLNRQLDAAMPRMIRN